MTVAAVLLGMIAWAFLALGSAPVMSARAELLIMALSIGAFALACRPRNARTSLPLRLASEPASLSVLWLRKRRTVPESGRCW